MTTLSRRSVPNADSALLGVVACAETTQKQKGGDSGDAKSDGGEGGQKLKKKGEELKAEMDALVDEIDEVLEENAEEFVKNYVQRGGQ
jgi:ubiquitin-like protein Pup